MSVDAGTWITAERTFSVHGRPNVEVKDFLRHKHSRDLQLGDGVAQISDPNLIGEPAQTRSWRNPVSTLRPGGTNI